MMRKLTMAILLVLCLGILSACGANGDATGGEKTPQAVADKFLTAIEQQDYNSFVSCITNENISEPQFNAFIRHLNGDDDIYLESLKLNLASSVSEWEHHTDGDTFNHDGRAYSIVEVDKKYKIQIQEGNVQFTSGVKDMKLTIVDTNETYTADSDGVIDVTIFPGQYNYRLLLETPLGNIDGEGDFSIHSFGKVERSLAHQYDGARYIIKSTDIYHNGEPCGVFFNDIRVIYQARLDNLIFGPFPHGEYTVTVKNSNGEIIKTCTTPTNEGKRVHRSSFNLHLKPVSGE